MDDERPKRTGLNDDTATRWIGPLRWRPQNANRNWIDKLGGFAFVLPLGLIVAAAAVSLFGGVGDGCEDKSWEFLYTAWFVGAATLASTGVLSLVLLLFRQGSGLGALKAMMLGMVVLFGSCAVNLGSNDGWKLGGCGREEGLRDWHAPTNDEAVQFTADMKVSLRRG